VTLGLGGGSHVYGNTLSVAPKQFVDAPGGADITDWADELAPCYDQARRTADMLLNGAAEQISLEKPSLIHRLSVSPTVRGGIAPCSVRMVSGNGKPVRLVSTVVARKTAIKPPCDLPVSRP
jgi:hypothetical protein